MTPINPSQTSIPEPLLPDDSPIAEDPLAQPEETMLRDGGLADQVEGLMPRPANIMINPQESGPPLEGLDTPNINTEFTAQEVGATATIGGTNLRYQSVGTEPAAEQPTYHPDEVYVIFSRRMMDEFVQMFNEAEVKSPGLGTLEIRINERG